MRTGEFGGPTPDLRRPQNTPSLLGAALPEHTSVIVDDFVARYRREFDFYDQVARLVAQILDTNLQSAGIRAIVTSRAKNPSRLEQKIRQRASRHTYQTLDDIYEDIVDLAGVRVALYFPGEREEVGKLLRRLFDLVEEPKTFPGDSASDSTNASYEKRFSGYSATHYRVQPIAGSLSEAQRRYSEAKVEVQVASVVMHAWAEVEHDLAYKPMEGELSLEEYAALDQLNGLVIAGEIALEQLQRAGESRVATRGRVFANHFDLAAFLFENVRSLVPEHRELNDAALGRVDHLFRLITEVGYNTPERLSPLLAVLHTDFERRPISEQLIDRLLSEDSSWYRIYERIRRGSLEGLPIEASERYTALGEFIALWIELESLIRDKATSLGYGHLPVLSRRTLDLMGLFDPGTREAIDGLRAFRNQLVHGPEIPNPIIVRDAAKELKRVLDRAKETNSAPPSQRKGRPRKKTT